MIKKYLRREIKSEINIVPLLDVLLVLLLVFMATAQMFIQSVEVDLPDSTEFGATDNDDNPQVIIEVFGTNQYTLVVNHQRQEQIPSEKLISEAHAQITANAKTIFLIGGAKNLPYNEIIKTLNLLHQAGVKSVGLMTHPI